MPTIRTRAATKPIPMSISKPDFLGEAGTAASVVFELSCGEDELFGKTGVASCPEGRD